MRLITIILPAVILLSCSKPGHHQVSTGTAITGWDGITVIKAFQEQSSDQVEVHIIMRPEMKNKICVLWYSIDSKHRTRQYKSALREGKPIDINIAVSPGAKISEIHITGYEKIAV